MTKDTAAAPTNQVTAQALGGAGRLRDILDLLKQGREFLPIIMEFFPLILEALECLRGMQSADRERVARFIARMATDDEGQRTKVAEALMAVKAD